MTVKTKTKTIEGEGEGREQFGERFVQLCKPIKVKGKLSPELVSYLDDIQKDYVSVMKFLIQRSGWGYLSWHDTHCDITTPAQSAALAVATHVDIPKLLEIIGKGGKPAENCYGLFSASYSPTTTLKSNNLISIIAYSLDKLTNDEFDDKVAQAKKYSHLISKQDWIAYRQRVQNGESVHDVRAEIAKKVGNPNIGVAALRGVKEDKIFPALIRSDKDYACALMYMVASSFSSWIESAKLHQKTRKVLAEAIAAAKQPQLFKLIVELSEELHKLDYGLSAKVFFESVKILTANKDQSDYALSCSELSKSKYQPLLTADKRALDSAYKSWKVHRKLKGMKPYTAMPKFEKSYLVPFGLTGRGMDFDMSVEKNHIVLKIGDHNVELFTNNYFDNPSVQHVRGKGGADFYRLQFRHTLKCRGKKKAVSKGEWKVAKINEIKFRKMTTGEYEVHIPYKIEHPKENFIVQRFFASADAEKTAKYLPLLPAEIITTGFDLNLSTPLTRTAAKFLKGSNNGELVSLLYGNGTITHEPEAVAKDTARSGRIVTLTGKARRLIDAIRSYKRLLIAEKQLSDEKFQTVKAKFIKEHQQPIEEELAGVPCGNFRHKIQTLTGQYNRIYRALKKECRDNGHKILSESVRLLALGDVMNSLNNSYSKFTPGKRTSFFKARQKRDNFRDFVSKQYAAQVAVHSLAVKANVTFIEDIDIELDSDKDARSNSISMLFAAGQLKKAIAIALNKVGIGCVFVNPAMTSQVDAWFGLFGFRDKLKDKGNLYVRRNGVIGKINSDLVASANVMIVGVNHSVFPRRIFVKNCRIINGSDDDDVVVDPDQQNQNKEGSKRMSRFLKERNLTHLSLDQNGKVVPGDQGQTLTGYVYLDYSGYMTEQQRNQWRDDIETDVIDLRKRDVKIESLSIICPAGSTYNAFRVS